MKHAQFEQIQGKQIFYILTEPKHTQKKMVIMSHGFRGSSIGPARTFVDLEKLLIENGYSVLRFDQPNSGNSEGDFINSSFNDWISTTSYFAKKYVNEGYQVVLLGQSMGATTTMIVAAQQELKDKIPCIILWVPDPKSTFDNDPNVYYEEGGQKYKGMFWQEAKQANFFKCLNEYEGGIHLVYGENDKFISQDLKNQVIETVKAKHQPVMILKGQDHSSWDYNESQTVYDFELKFLKDYLL